MKRSHRILTHCLIPKCFTSQAKQERQCVAYVAYAHLTINKEGQVQEHPTKHSLYVTPISTKAIVTEWIEKLISIFATRRERQHRMSLT